MDCVKNTVLSLIVSGAIMTVSLFYSCLTLLSMGFQRLKQGKDYWYIKERNVPPSCLQDKAYGRHSYLKLETIKLHYVENGDRNKPLMLFVHGFPEFWYSWRHQMKHFASTHWVVAIDMRGYGDSEKPGSVKEYSVEKLVKDVHDVVKALNKNKCILVGHDWGGIICWNVAAYYPEIIEKLIIMNSPHPGAMKKKLQSSLKQFLKSWYMFMFQMPYLPEQFFLTQDLDAFNRMFRNSVDKRCSVSDEDMEAFKYTFSRKGAWTPPINYYRMALTANNLMHPKKLAKIRAPTLVIWGEMDIALEKDLPELARDYVDNMNISYVADANHFVQQDRPEQVNHLMEKFVK